MADDEEDDQCIVAAASLEEKHKKDTNYLRRNRRWTYRLLPYLLEPHPPGAPALTIKLNELDLSTTPQQYNDTNLPQIHRPYPIRVDCYGSRRGGWR